MTQVFNSCEIIDNGHGEVPLSSDEYLQILDLQKEIFALLTVGRNTQDVFERLCQLAEMMLPGAVASIMLLDRSSGLMDVACAPSIPPVGHDALRGLKPGPGGGSCGNAVFSNKPQFVTDTKSDERWSDIRQIAYDFNLCSCWSMPIRNTADEAIGSFALSSFEHRSPSAFHKKLLENCAFIVSMVHRRSEYESQIDAAQNELIAKAYYDHLTKLPNRQKIVMDLEKTAPKGCLILNIDDFKEVNDFFGISAGDTVLVQIGRWLQEIGLSPYRIAGDEFALLIHDDLTLKELHHRIDTLISLVEEKIFMVGDEMFNLRITVGAAMGEGKLLTRADIALHTAKQKKIPIAFYEENENVEELYRTNIAMSGKIRKALANERVICHYQPIINLLTGKTEKYETLVRMVDEDGTLIPPMEFLPIAKKTRLYPQITREVVYRACELFAGREETFSINLSDSDIRDAHTVNEIIRTITRTQTAPRIVFEILESEGIESFDSVRQFITQVKALGAKISIDDFGTGYSNFENVLKLGVDYLKIDGSLIRGMTSNERHSIIVETIVDFAQKIGAKTVAEFVGDEATYEAVKGHGIDYAQGYYTGKPAPLE